MNIHQNINKLLYALSTKDKFYKINSFQYYSNKTNKYCTKYQVLRKELDKFIVIDEFYKKIDILKFLIAEYKRGSEVDE